MKLLISSAANKIPLIKAALQACQKLKPQPGLVAGDYSSQVLSAYIAPEFWQMPATEDANLQALIDGCQARNISWVLPTRDGELEFWTRHAASFNAAGIQVLVSPQPVLNLCLDKLAFAQLGKEQGLNIIPASLNWQQLNASSYVVKERYGAGSHSLGLNLSPEAAQAHAQKLQAPIFQPFIQGEEISIDAWHNQQGQLQGLVLRKRELVMQGESQVTRTFTNHHLEQQAEQLLQQLALNGHSVTQALIDAQGQLHFIECNPRFGGASTASIQAGLTSLEWSLRQAKGEDLSAYPFQRSATEICQIRLPTDFYI